jgi:hypothetical protein
MLVQTLTTFAVAFVALFIGIVLMNIRYIFKGEPFRGSCAQNNPMLKNQIGDCQVCGRKAEEECKMPEVHN